MTVFWSLATVMVMVALLFVLPPLLRKRELSAMSPDELNIQVIRSQIADLDAANLELLATALKIEPSVIAEGEWIANAKKQVDAQAA